MKKLLVTLMVLSVLLGSLFAQGQAEQGAKKTVDYPTKEITLIVPWNPGGTNDLMARALQPVFKEMYNVDLVVKNVPGGGSAVGIMEAQTAKPDGYTLGLSTSSFVALITQGRLQTKIEDATNIMLFAEEPVCMVVKNNGKYADANALLNAAKANPGKISVGIPGSNNVNQAYATLLQKPLNTTFLFMPFDGGSRVIAEILGGHIDSGVLKPSEVINLVRSGELKIVGVFNKEGLGLLPEVPTFDKLGYDVFSLGVIRHIGYLMGPKGIDPLVVEKITEMFTAGLKSPAYQTFANQVGIVANPISGKEFEVYFKEVYDGLANASREIFTK
jgi:tripartite-type tricarboxylate transporter receptor subunit TctC